MSIARDLLPEWKQESAVTRRLLEVVPHERAGFKPHPRSSSLGELAVHVASIPAWGPSILSSTELDVNPPGGSPFRPPVYTSKAALLEMYDDSVTRLGAALENASDEHLAVRWTLKNGGATIFAMPRSYCLRSFLLNHLIHHRGQLTVYLRLCDVPLPSVYGPTADAAR